MSLFPAPGTTKEGYISEKEGLPALRFRYKVMSMSANRAINTSNFNLPRTLEAMEEHVKLETDVIAKHLIDWDAKDDSGNKVEITPENLAAMDYGAYMELRNIVMGIKASDPLPGEKKD